MESKTEPHIYSQESKHAWAAFKGQAKRNAKPPEWVRPDECGAAQMLQKSTTEVFTTVKKIKTETWAGNGLNTTALQYMVAVIQLEFASLHEESTFLSHRLANSLNFSKVIRRTFETSPRSYFSGFFVCVFHPIKILSKLCSWMWSRWLGEHLC